MRGSCVYSLIFLRVFLVLLLRFGGWTVWATGLRPGVEPIQQDKKREAERTGFASGHGS